LIGLIWLIAAGFFPFAGAQAQPAVTVAVLGDSLVAGYGLPAEDGFVPQLQRWLTAHGVNAKLINAGVSGDTTAGGLARIDWTLTPDVNALIVSLGGNDVLRGIAPEVARKNLEGILLAAQARNLPVMLVGIAAPGNYGPDYQQAFAENYRSLANAFGALLYPDFLHVLNSRPDRAETLRSYFQPDHLHPNTRGVALIVQDMGSMVAKLVSRAATAAAAAAN